MSNRFVRFFRPLPNPTLIVFGAVAVGAMVLAFMPLFDLSSHSTMIAVPDNRAQETSSFRTEYVPQWSFDGFVRKHSFPYAVSTSRESTILAQYSKIAIGMSESEVLHLMGAPDYDQSAYTKRNPPRLRGFNWTYLIYDDDSNIVNELQEKYVAVFFDTGSVVVDTVDHYHRPVRSARYGEIHAF